MSSSTVREISLLGLVRLSLAVSDRPAPYTRAQMHRDHRRMLKRQRSLAQAAAR
jgi:hypothetical protein